ncbi:MAG: class I SAM-dependent methyltransferase [Bacteroidota bacterium]|nr:class I SAM-dependent methyltransferase [Bacteroidota bacterium]
MEIKLSKKIIDILACPYCGNPLKIADNQAICTVCQDKYTTSNKGQIDFRLRRGKTVQLQFEVGTNLLPEKGFDFKVLNKNPFPEVDYTNFKVPSHLNNELLSYFPKAKGQECIMLDLGCGTTVHKGVCEHAGFEYVGLDYDNSSDAYILGDGHALPFKDNSFDFILSIAVLEHIQNPFIMMKEVYRVLKPEGKLIGTVAFMEPFHGNSFYHHSHLGVFNSLSSSGFEIEKVAPSATWSVLKAQAIMGLFPRLSRSLAHLLVLPLYLLHRIWWKLGSYFSNSYRSSEKYRILYSTGSFSFIATKGEGKKQ